MTEDKILKALQKAVIAAVAAAASTDLPATAVKYVGRNFTPPGDKAWLEVVHIPNNITGEFWADGKTYQGLLRLILHWPMVDKGAYTPIILIESIGNYFTKGSKFTQDDVVVTVTDNPDLMAVMEEPPYMILPLSIRYRHFKVP